MSESPSLDGLRVLAHPVRLRILSLLTGVAMSAAEAARELGETQANISYHLRRLHEAGLLDVAEEVRIRGGLAKRYRHDPESGGRFASTNPQEEQLLIAAMAEELKRRGEFLGQQGSATDAEIWVDRENWEKALEHARELSELLHAAARPPRTRGTIPVSATVSLFEMTRS
ncbi:ArsR/SmtB family transcription factor [Amycolatopsis umgeniensis]|uniref:DNA-binding transcriptional ArsR family regulator n=1 Tax=Amycolatopsis umgeniensis TaxID=336628 RepID=A0A841AXJ9_9PSEU|nr:helix-turn-helix domain-containing protein [Amycolatopsis umgeniensis]MBB5852596.1 DNA-binding transcriptional ArsR family regulator [Amycolatopsis umgeniensis]